MNSRYDYLPVSCFDINTDSGFRTGYWKNEKLEDLPKDKLSKAMEYCSKYKEYENKAKEIYEVYKRKE